MRRGPALIVEDFTPLREAVECLLAAEGIDVLTASDGGAALKILRSRPDVRVIVLDVVMPEIEGFEFRRAQLADPQLALIPVVLMTSLSDFRAVGAQLGAFASFKKPVTMSDFMEAVMPLC